MSRVGSSPIKIADGVDFSVKDSSVLFFKNKKAEVSYNVPSGINFVEEDRILTFSVNGELSKYKAIWGTTRANVANIIKGLTDGFEKKLEVNGVGYRANVKGKVLVLQLGFSHDIEHAIPDGIDIKVEKNLITISGYDKQKVGAVASKIRSYRPPEPYKGKGVKYVDEVITRKEGKKK